MRKDEALEVLTTHQRELKEFGVSSIALFGSVARNEAREGSDVDILVEFSIPVGLFHFVRLKNYLEKLLGASVDLVTPDAIRIEMRDEILKDAVYAA